MLTKINCILLFLLMSLFLFSQNNYSVYFGNLHSHTSYSDGSGSPAEAFQYAKDSAHLDFLAVTDHMEQLISFYLTMTNSAADNATTSAFVGIAGYEWGSPYYGHINVFNTTEMPSALTYSSWSDFRDWMLENHPPAFAQFNHPGDEVTFNNWYDFEYKGPETDSCFHLLEFQNIQQATDWYEVALNNGWHVCPVWNQDNHSPDWGTKNDGRAGIWATALTKTALFDAINKGRTFATMDKNASVWLTCNNIEMGSVANVNGFADLNIVLNDNDGEQFSSVEIISNNGVVYTFNNISSASLTANIDVTNLNYAFIRAIQTDGDYLWSAPVYFSHMVNLFKNSVSEISVYPNPSTDIFNISFPDDFKSNELKIDIFDLAGQSVLNNVAISSSSKYLKINAEKLLPGLYLIKILNTSFLICKT